MLLRDKIISSHLDTLDLYIISTYAWFSAYIVLKIKIDWFCCFVIKSFIQLNNVRLLL